MNFGIDSNSEAAAVTSAIALLGKTNVKPWVAKASKAAAAPVSFVCRYLFAHKNANLEMKEVLALSDAGLKIVSICELTADLDHLTFDNGYKDGAYSWKSAAALSQPLGTPVYFAVDNCPTPAQLGKVTDYFKGVRKSLDEYNAKAGSGSSDGSDAYAIGVYGMEHVLTHCKSNDLATFFWQFGGTSAWAGYNIRQLYGPNFGGPTGASDVFKNGSGAVMGEKFCGLGVDFNLSDGSEGSWSIDSAQGAQANGSTETAAPGGEGAGGAEDKPEEASGDTKLASKDDSTSGGEAQDPPAQEGSDDAKASQGNQEAAEGAANASTDGDATEPAPDGQQADQPAAEPADDSQS